MKSFLRILTLCLFSLVCESFAADKAWYFTASDINALHSKPADEQIVYGSEPLQFGRLRLPNSEGPHPVAIVIHGGCWTSKFATIQNTEALADALRDQGMATWNIEYRGTDASGGGWPGTFEDVGSAADFLREIASKYSLDLSRVVVVGHSAGGHLALWLAARHKIQPESALFKENPLVLRGVIALGGIPDLKAFRKLGNSDQGCGEDVVGKLLGGAPDLVSEHFMEASPKELLPLGAPQILIYGADDLVVPAELGRAYMQVAQKKGDSVELFVVKGAAHHEYAAPNSVAWPVVKTAVISLQNGATVKNTGTFQCLLER